MKHISRHHNLTTAVLLAALAATSACSDEGDGPVVAGDEVSVYMSRAEGVADQGEYALVFWEEGKKDAAWEWLLDGTAKDATPAEGQVDYYQFDGVGGVRTNYLVNKPNGDQLIYDRETNNYVYAMGYYPHSLLQTADNYSTFTLRPPLTDKNAADYAKFRYSRPGLVDVCITDIEKGRHTEPFVTSKQNELQFRHTQVKLDFQFRQTEDVHGRVINVRVLVPGTAIADSWKLGTSSYVASRAAVPSDLVFAAGVLGWIENPLEFTPLTYMEGALGDFVSADAVSTLTDCYVMPGSSMFTGEEGQQKYLKFYMSAEIYENDELIPDRRMEDYVEIPLTDDEGNPWTDAVSAGDHFRISLVFTQNQLKLYAQKVRWDYGGWLIIPLNPDDPDASDSTKQP